MNLKKRRETLPDHNFEAQVKKGSSKEMKEKEKILNHSFGAQVGAQREA